MRKDDEDAVTTFDELLTSDGTPRHPALSECVSHRFPSKRCGTAATCGGRTVEKGITFAVYGHNDGNEKIWPFDVVPPNFVGRMGLNRSWLEATHPCIKSVSGRRLRGRTNLQGRSCPEELVKSAKTYRPECIGFRRHRVACGLTLLANDLVRNHDGTIYVLEDNLRVRRV